MHSETCGHYAGQVQRTKLSPTTTQPAVALGTVDRHKPPLTRTSWPPDGETGAGHEAGMVRRQLGSM